MEILNLFLTILKEILPYSLLGVFIIGTSIYLIQEEIEYKRFMKGKK